jgi:hypothetical protein
MELLKKVITTFDLNTEKSPADRFLMLTANNVTKLERRDFLSTNVLRDISTEIPTSHAVVEYVASLGVRVHTHVPVEVGLGNVTNDKQLKENQLIQTVIADSTKIPSSNAIFDYLQTNYLNKLNVIDVVLNGDLRVPTSNAVYDFVLESLDGGTI